jgi:integrase
LRPRKPCGALFIATSPTTFNHALYAAGDRVTARPGTIAAPLERKSGHDLRSTFGMWMLAQGVAVSEIALMMGHRDSRMAEKVYARDPAQNAAGAAAVALPAGCWVNSGNRGNCGDFDPE